MLDEIIALEALCVRRFDVAESCRESRRCKPTTFADSGWRTNSRTPGALNVALEVAQHLHELSHHRHRPLVLRRQHDRLVLRVVRRQHHADVPPAFLVLGFSLR